MSYKKGPIETTLLSITLTILYANIVIVLIKLIMFTDVLSKCFLMCENKLVYYYHVICMENIVVEIINKFRSLLYIYKIMYTMSFKSIKVLLSRYRSLIL